MFARAPDRAENRRDQADRARSRCPRRMSSTVSANLATAYQIKGMNFSITSACSTSLHCIGMAAQQIALGQQDVMFGGGGEELDWTLSCLFDAMGAMSSQVQRHARKASRAFDAGRDGFVISGGGAHAWCWKASNMRRRAARRSTPKSLVSAPLPTGPTWSRRRARAASGRCAARCKTLGRGPQGQLHQRAWHLDARGRRGRGRGGAPRLRRRRDAADQLDQVDDRPQPGRDRRAGGDLLPAGTGTRFHHPFDQRRNARSRARSRKRSPRAAWTMPGSIR